MSAPKKVK